MKSGVAEIDRLAMRGRPEGPPMIHQTWEKLLFLHWAFSPELIRPLIPDRLEIDTFDGRAWIGLTPLTVSHLKLTSLPPIPGTSSFHELNMRTYVHFNGVPGVWFFTLEASKIFPALAARIYFSLAYRKAEISFEAENTFLNFKSHRRDKTDANFHAIWRPVEPLPSPAVDSLDFFLIERYCLFAAHGKKILKARINHVPWALRAAELVSFQTTFFEWLGLPEPIAAPLVHYADEQQVDIWAPEEF